MALKFQLKIKMTDFLLGLGSPRDFFLSLGKVPAKFRACR